MFQLTVLCCLFAVVYCQTGTQTSVAQDNMPSQNNANSTAVKGKFLNLGNGGLGSFLLFDQLSKENVSAACILVLSNLISQQGRSQVRGFSRELLSRSLSPLLALSACDLNSNNLIYLLFSNGFLNNNNNNFNYGPCTDFNLYSPVNSFNNYRFPSSSFPDRENYCYPSCGSNRRCERSNLGQCECTYRPTFNSPTSCYPPCSYQQVCQQGYPSNRCVYSQPQAPNPSYPVCQGNRVYSTCGSCEIPCNQQTNYACTLQCRVGCTCPPNHFVNNANICVRKEQCNYQNNRCRRPCRSNQKCQLTYNGGRQRYRCVNQQGNNCYPSCRYYEECKPDYSVFGQQTRYRCVTKPGNPVNQPTLCYPSCSYPYVCQQGYPSNRCVYSQPQAPNPSYPTTSLALCRLTCNSPNYLCQFDNTLNEYRCKCNSLLTLGAVCSISDTQCGCQSNLQCRPSNIGLYSYSLSYTCQAIPFSLPSTTCPPYYTYINGRCVRFTG